MTSSTPTGPSAEQDARQREFLAGGWPAVAKLGLKWGATMAVLMSVIVLITSRSSGGNVGAMVGWTAAVCVALGFLYGALMRVAISRSVARRDGTN
jgi:hypothetical protein